MNELLPAQITQPIAAPSDPGELRRAELRQRLALQERPLTAKQRAFSERYVVCRNMTQAYRETHDVVGRSSHHHVSAWEVMQVPQVWRYVKELEREAAQMAKVDVAAILATDLAIVEAAAHADALSSYVVECCRFCHGKNHLKQWRDDHEYDLALCAVLDFNAKAPEGKALDLPSDEGGYGFDPRQEPVITCPSCEGRGLERAIIADTSKIGPASPLFKGIKVTKNGIEVLLHDVDKAKERLLRAAGAFGDDAASVARGAAAGAAVGHAAAAAVAAKAKDMSADELRKAYLTLVG